MPVVKTTGILELITQSGLLVQVVLLLLIATSVFCWAIIFSKYNLFRKSLRQDHDFLALFWKSKSLDEIFAKIDQYPTSNIARVFTAGFKELQKLSHSDLAQDINSVDNIQRALVRSASTQVADQEKHLNWLATTASAAPFVGLFGTVWGIMTSFQDIASVGSANLAVVAPGISEALIATAVGLATAIPAVVAYNHFVNRIKRFAVDMECFAQDFLNIVQRGLLSGLKKK